MPRRTLEATAMKIINSGLPSGFSGYMYIVESEVEINDAIRSHGLDSVKWTIHDPVTDADITASITPSERGMLDDIAEDFVLGLSTSEVVAEGITMRPLT